MFKKCLFQIHWFFGITVGLLLSLIGITGAILSYEEEILRWINSDSYKVQAEVSPRLTPAGLYQHFMQQNPNAIINSITVNTSPTEAATVNIVQEGARHGLNVMVNPYTAQTLPSVRGMGFFKYVELIHRGLIAGMTGRQVVGFCMLMLIFFVLSGIYLRWPSKHSIKQWLFLKPQLTGRNFIWNLHAVVGTWMVVFYLLFAVTGLTWSYSWWRSGFYTVLGVENVQRNAPNSSVNTPSLSSNDTTQLMQQAWDSFHRQLGSNYSSLTINTPKDTQTVNISFFDAIP